MKAFTEHSNRTTIRAKPAPADGPFFSRVGGNTEDGVSTEVPELQRNPLGDIADGVSNWWGDVTDSRPDEERLDALEDLAVFRRRRFSVENHHPTAGRGLFDATYNPSSGVLDINVKVNFDLRNGNPFNADWMAANGGFIGAARAMLHMENFVWTEDEKVAWRANAIRDVRNAWQDQHVFHTTRAHWDSLPNVHVHINIIETDQADAHYVISVGKWPNDSGLDEFMTRPGTANQSSGQLEETTVNGIANPDENDFRRTTNTRAGYNIVATNNPGTVQFAQGQDTISAADRARLVTFGNTLGQPQIPPFPVTIIGRASSEGTEQDNDSLAFRRALAVNNVIVGAGAKEQPTVRSEGETGATEDPAWRRAEIRVGDFRSEQSTVVHEFGHIFGLDDEYPTADGGDRDVGVAVDHSAMAQRLIPGQQPVLAHHNRNVMSNGEEIQPHHYVTFLEVLGNMTGTTGEWSIGPGPGSHAHEPGDFPLPQPGDPQTA